MDRRIVVAALLVIVGGAALIWGIKSTGKREPGYKDKVHSEPVKQAEVAADSATPKPARISPQVDAGDVKLFNDTLALAERLAGEGKLTEAKDVYKKIIQDFASESEAKSIQDKIWDLNIKIMFSPIKTDDSVVYEVKSGDTLYEIARKFGTTIELLKESNSLRSDLIRIGQRLKVVTSKPSILVDKSQNILTLKMGDEIFKVYRCSTGEGNSTPIGEFTIVNKLINPTWYKRGEVVPPDSPDNILGTRWMGFDMPEYGIHGTTEPETIGSQVTAGCIRLHNNDVEELYKIIPVGTKVTIID